jgi:hypothetical protein
MKWFRPRRPSPALVISLIALFVAMGGTGYAATQLAKNSVGTKQLKKNAVVSSKIKKNAVIGSKIKNNAITGSKVKDHSLTGADINLSALGAVPTASHAANADHATSADTVGNVTLVPVKRLAATDGADFASAESAAPPVQLFSKGPFTIYAKCFRNTGSDQLWPEVFIATTQNGSVLNSDDSNSGGANTLDSTTTEQSRILTDGDGPATTNNLAGEDPDFTMFYAAAPDGTTLQGAFIAMARNGTVANSSPLYGSGNACLVFGRVLG